MLNILRQFIQLILIRWPLKCSLAWRLFTILDSESKICSVFYSLRASVIVSCVYKTESVTLQTSWCFTVTFFYQLYLEFVSNITAFSFYCLLGFSAFPQKITWTLIRGIKCTAEIEYTTNQRHAMHKTVLLQTLQPIFSLTLLVCVYVKRDLWYESIFISLCHYSYHI